MQNAELYALFGNQLLVLGISVTRLAVAFILLPLFSNELVPAMVRNSIFIALGLIILIVQPPVTITGLNGFDWARLIGKEVFVGLAIGVFFGVFLWAFESAGVLIDTQVGSTIGQLYDPLSGHQVTLMGELLGRWVNYLFMTAGGLLLITGAVLESYALWPIDRQLPDLQYASVQLFETEFSRFMTLTLLLASPVILVTFLIDMSMGLVNRFAPQLNVLFLSMSFKALASVFLLIILLPTLTTVFVNELTENSAGVIQFVNSLFAPVP